MTKERSLEEQMMNDAVGEVVPDNSMLKSLSSLAAKQLMLEEKKNELERKLKEVTSDLRRVQEVDVPEMMFEIGISSFKMNDGGNITIKEDVYASMRSDKTLEAMRWLDDHQLGDIVKQDVRVKFGRGEGDKAALLVKFAEEHGWNPIDKQSVHPQTLKAVVREQLARGVEFPEDLFSIAPVRKSIIKFK